MCLLRHVPTDETLASLLVGLTVGATLAIGSYVAMTQSWLHQLTALIEWMRYYGIAIWITIAIITYIYIRIGWCTSESEKKLTTEERLAAIKRNVANFPQRSPNGWYKLCDSSQIKVGDTKSVLLLTKDVALFRAAGEKKTGAGRGIVHVLDAYCPHLGANMGHGGKVDENRLECPFHGWQFDTFGECTHIPYASKIPSTARTGVWRTIERNGAVWTWWHVDHQQPNGTEEEIPNTEIEEDKHRLTVHGRATIEVPGNILEVVCKNADVWTGDCVRDDGSMAAIPTVAGFSWRWPTEKREWQFDTPTESASSSSTSCVSEATLSTRSVLCLFGIPLPFLSFAVTLTHIGPSLLTHTWRPTSLIGRAIFGKAIDCMQTFRPESGFINIVEWSVDTRRESQLGLLYPLHVLLAPLRRALSKVILSLTIAQFCSRVMPVYTPRIIKLSLLNSGGAREAMERASRDSDDETTQNVDTNAAGDADATKPEPIDDGSDSLRLRTRSSASVAPSSSPVSPPPLSRRVRGYPATSRFYTAFFSRFYSQSTNKKQDTMNW